MSELPPNIPDYTLLKPVGRGAYGEVWLARSVTGVYRAVKIVRRSSFLEERPFEREFAGIQRFEAISLGMDSQVGLLHVGRNDEAGIFYYVMELADDIETGEDIFPDRYVPKTLKEVQRRRRRLSTGEALDISLSLSRALAHLHARALVHRDIKPSNVIFVHGVPKLADIGLVSNIDTSNSFVGTEGFVPPEGPGTAAADVYSLGKVIYEMTTGRDRHDFPKLPDDLDALPDKREMLELNELVLKACDRDRESRYPSAEALREELLLLQAGKSIRRLHVVEQRFALVAKYGIVATIISALTVAGLIWASAQTRRAEEGQRRAQLAEEAALAQLHRANLNWVRANRVTGQPGQHFDSLAELTRAAARTNSLDLRNEAIECLLVPDLRPVKQWRRTAGLEPFNISGSLSLYGSNDLFGNVTIRSTADDVLKFQLPTPGLPPASGILSPDDRYLAIKDVAGQNMLWDLLHPTQKPLGLQPSPDASPVEFTPDSRTVVLKHKDSSLHFVNVTSGVETASFPAPEGLSWLRFDRTGERLLIIAGGQPVICRAADGQRLSRLKVSEPVYCGAWHPDGSTLALGCRKRILLWDVDSNRETGTLLGHGGQVIGLSFTEGGEWLASTSWDASTRLWQIDAAREILRLPRHGSEMELNAAQGKLVFKAAKHIQLYELAVPRAMQRFTVPSPPLHVDPWTALATFGPVGDLAAVLDLPGVYLFQLPDPKPLALLPVGKSYRTVFQRDGNALFTCGSDGLMCWPMKWSGDRTAVCIGPPSPMAQTRGLPVGIFILSDDGRLLLTQTQNGYEAFNPRDSSPAVRADAAVEVGQVPYMSPNGNFAASVATKRHVRVQVWSPRTGSLITNLPGVREVEMAFSPDSRWLAFAESKDTVLWSTDDWTPRVRIPHPADTSGRYRLGFSPDSQILAVSVAERGTRLVQVKTGQELATLPTERLLNSLMFSPDGSRLASSEEPGRFQVWNLRILREELASRGLDWPGPPLQPEISGGLRPRINVTVIKAAAAAVASTP